TALLAASDPAATAPPFSRSRWIAERADRFRYSGGLLPADRAAVAAHQEALEALGSIQAPARRPPPGQMVRVSFNLLRPDGGEAQPETQAEPFLAINPEREANLVAGYQEGRFESGGARALAYAFTTDGRRWREGLLPGLTLASGGTFERASDPWVAFGPGGRVYYASLALDETTPRNGIFVSVSRDGGRTWGALVPVHTTTTEFDDKESIVVDTRADSPFRGRVYVAWDSDTGSRQSPRVATSADDGASYGPPVEITSSGFANFGLVPLIGPGGVVHVVWLQVDGTRENLVSARSEDGGATWSQPVPVADSRPVGVADLRTAEGLPAAAIDPASGAIYVAWQDGRFTPGVDQIVLAVSTDGGESWSEPRRISDGPDDAPSFTPALAVNGQGQVAVSYYSLRNDPARRFLFDLYLGVSADQGETFRPSQRVTPGASDVRFAAFARGFFLGDYQGLTGGRIVFTPFWISTFARSARSRAINQPDAYTRTVRP
ncbi:MAG TPA: sialidase family protein, partial [Thermoanaerobaculia bacterium]|nr:sialidase family protein [Thermoanaerobaculia bacterium]